jgi:IclR family KDG regulon transcriptional repressor
MDATFLKGLSALEVLALSDEPRGVTELARELGITKSNAHRLLQALVHRGFARNVENGRYALTLKVWELGAHVLARVDVKKAAAPFLQDLVDATGESVHLSVLVEGDVVYLDKIDSPHPVRAYSQIGKRAPAYAVATGKALLAYQKDGELFRLVDPIERFTARTATDLEDLRKELSRVRHLGYAVNRGEWREGVCGLAAPIRDSSGSVVASVGISGPASRLPPGVLKDHARVVMDAAASISRALGFRLKALGEIA